jgi:hypothetical protein
VYNGVGEAKKRKKAFEDGRRRGRDEVGRAFMIRTAEVGVAETDMILEAEEGVEMMELDRRKMRAELFVELGDEEIKLPTGIAKEGRRKANQKAVSVFGKGVAGRIEKADGKSPRIGRGRRGGDRGKEGVTGAVKPPLLVDKAVDLGEIGGKISRVAETVGDSGEKGHVVQGGGTTGVSLGSTGLGNGGDGEEDSMVVGGMGKEGSGEDILKVQRTEGVVWGVSRSLDLGKEAEGKGRGGTGGGIGTRNGGGGRASGKRVRGGVHGEGREGRERM